MPTKMNITVLIIGETTSINDLDEPENKKDILFYSNEVEPLISALNSIFKKYYYANGLYERLHPNEHDHYFYCISGEKSFNLLWSFSSICQTIITNLENSKDTKSLQIFCNWFSKEEAVYEALKKIQDESMAKARQEIYEENLRAKKIKLIELKKELGEPITQDEIKFLKDAQTY